MFARFTLINVFAYLFWCDLAHANQNAFVAKEYMIVTANSYASWAGKNIIENNGNAIDAAVAVQAMLTLTEPQSSGIGGGAFILYWDNKAKKLYTYDGRETAPSGVNAFWFMQDNQPIARLDVVIGGKSVGVPGVLRALEMAHKAHGALPWRELFDDAIDVSGSGFTVSKRLSDLLRLKPNKGITRFPVSSTYFYPAGNALQEGSKKKNPRLAKTLQEIAKHGSDYFYTGELAERIVDAVQSAKINPGVLTLDDLKHYKALQRQAVCGPYRSFKICGMAPPSTGGINVLQILTMLETKNLSHWPINSVEFVQLFTQASAKAYADRDAFIADSDFTQLPYAALINEAYLARRAETLDVEKTWKRARAGSPYSDAQLYPGRSIEQPNTTHISIVDKQGNAVSMTSSIEFTFGSGIMVEGFLLNNQLTDFSFNPSQSFRRVLNVVEPRKRPRSAMSPTMVFNNQGDLSLVIGSPGGSRIIDYVAHTLTGVIDYHLDIQQAINLPKVTNRNDYTALENHTLIQSLKPELEKLGHHVEVIDLNSGLHGIQVKDGRLIGGADPRGEGIAVGK